MAITFLNLKSISDTPDEIVIEDCDVSIETVKRFEYDKQNPVNRRKRIQFGQYFENNIALSPVIKTSEYLELCTFINNSELVSDEDTGLGLYLKIDIEGGLLEFPVTSITLPKLTEDLVFYRDFSSIKITSENSGNPHLPDFLDYGSGNYGADSYGY